MSLKYEPASEPGGFVLQALCGADEPEQTVHHHLAPRPCRYQGPRMSNPFEVWCVGRTHLTLVCVLLGVFRARGVKCNRQQIVRESDVSDIRIQGDDL